LKKTLQDVQNRLSQTIQAVDEQRNWLYRTVLFFGMVVCTTLIIWVGMSLWRSYNAPLTPPELTNGYMPIPVMIDGKPVLLGVGIVKWQVPPELNAILVQVEKERQAQAAAATQQAAKDAATQPTTAPAAK
jgi:hypothetical protein